MCLPFEVKIDSMTRGVITAILCMANIPEEIKPETYYSGFSYAELPLPEVYLGVDIRCCSRT